MPLREQPKVHDGMITVTELIGICFLPRRRFIDAARVRENWFPLALILGGSVPDANKASSVEFRCFSTFLGHRVAAGGAVLVQGAPAVERWDAAGGVSPLAEPRTGGHRARRLPLRPPFSIREHILVVGQRVHVVPRFVGAGPWNRLPALLCVCSCSARTG